MTRSKLAFRTRSAPAVGERLLVVPDDVLDAGLDLGPASGGDAVDDPEHAEHTRTSKVAMAVPAETLIEGDSMRTR